MGTRAINGDASRPYPEARIDGHLIRVLEFANQHLGMDAAFVTESSPHGQLNRSFHGDAQSFGMVVGEPSVSYCDLMIAGEIPHAIPAAVADSRVRDLAVTLSARIGAYIGVPIMLADGSAFGSLACMSHDAHVLGDRDVRFMKLLADLLAP